MRTIYFAILTLLPLISVADEGAVYKIEKDGVVQYTNKPPSAGAKPAQLPKLGRWELRDVKVPDVTCDKHGGINCALGADTDGSVVCLDNFRDAVSRFQFECTSAKLELVSVSEPQADGTITVTVRNSKSIKAEKPSITYRPGRFAAVVNLSGPDEIEGFGLGEFVLQTKSKELAKKPSPTQLDIRCENCG